MHKADGFAAHAKHQVAKELIRKWTETAHTLAVVVCEFFKGIVGDRRVCRKARNSTQAHTVQVNLRYDKADLSRILLYVKAHDLERQGRYDSRIPSRLTIWTHAWRNTGCREESCVMFSLAFDWKTTSLMAVVLLSGYDWEAFVDELAVLERAALGKSVYGRRRREPTT